MMALSARGLLDYIFEERSSVENCVQEKGYRRGGDGSDNQAWGEM